MEYRIQIITTLRSLEQVECLAPLPILTRDELLQRAVLPHGHSLLDAHDARDAVIKILTANDDWHDLLDSMLRRLTPQDAIYVFPPGVSPTMPPVLSLAPLDTSPMEHEASVLISPKVNTSNPQAVFDLLKLTDPVTRVPYLPDHLLVHALQLCGLNPTHQTVAEMASAADVDQNGQIEVHEFLLYCESLQYTRPDRASLRETFRHFDVDGNGYLDRDEFAQLLRAEGEPLSDDEVAIALSIADANGDGKIDLEEFVRLLCDTRYDMQTSSTVSPAPVPESPETILKQDELSSRLELSRQRAAANHRRRVQEQGATSRLKDDTKATGETNRQATDAPAKAGSSGGCCLVA